MAQDTLIDLVKKALADIHADTTADLETKRDSMEEIQEDIGSILDAIDADIERRDDAQFQELDENDSLKNEDPNNEEDPDD